MRKPLVQVYLIVCIRPNFFRRVFDSRFADVVNISNRLRTAPWCRSRAPRRSIRSKKIVASCACKIRAGIRSWLLLRLRLIFERSVSCESEKRDIKTGQFTLLSINARDYFWDFIVYTYTYVYNVNCILKKEFNLKTIISYSHFKISK